MDARARADFAAHAARIRPLLNRLVYFGVETCRGQLGSRDAVRAPVLPVRIFRALTTSQLTRLAPELTALGYRRTGKAGGAERWEGAESDTLELESSAESFGAEAESGILEYATLMTVSVGLESGDSVRVAALPAQIALLWRSHLRDGKEFSASVWAEDLIEIVVRRVTIREDVASLPEELRASIAKSAGEFAASESALWTIERALPDARTAPGCAALALERFRQIAALATVPA
jgi:hypothetical protein